MTIYLLERGVGVSDAAAEPRSGTIELYFRGEPVDGVFVGGKLFPVVRGCAAVNLDGFDGVINVTARNSATRKVYTCENLLVVDDYIIPIQAFAPAEYVAMAAEAEQKVKELETKIKNLEAAVFGIPLFGKEN